MRRAALIATLLAVPALAQAAPKKLPKGAPAAAADPAPAPADPNAAAGAAPTSNAPTGKGPVGKTPGVCGAKVWPLVEGNEWTYAGVAPLTPPTDQMKKISPLQPKTIVITVKSIDAKKGADTVVTLTEKVTVEVVKENKELKQAAVVDEHTLETTVTCNAKTKFEISPDSFLFAGEPGGTYGLKVDSFDRSHDTSWKLTNGGIGDAEWREDIVAKWTRVPTPGSDAKLGSGKLELERKFTPQQPELIYTKLGSFRAEKIALITTGRVTLDSPAVADEKPMELPAGWLSTFWLADATGPVQIINAYSQMYQLVDAKLK